MNKISHTFNNLTVLKQIESCVSLDFINPFLSEKIDVYLFGGVLRDMVIGRNWKDVDFSICLDLPHVQRHLRIEELFAITNTIIQSKTIVSKEFAVYRVVPLHNGARSPIDIRVAESLWAGGSDFSINALRFDIKTERLIDCFNSVSDINNKVIKTIHDCDIVFSENPLMLFRTMKIACELGFEIDYSVSRAMERHLTNIDVCIDIVTQKKSGLSGWFLANMLAGLKYNPYLYQHIFESTGSLSQFLKKISTTLNLKHNSPPFFEKLFVPGETMSFERAISLFFSAIARSICSQNAEIVFTEIVCLFGIDDEMNQDLGIDSSKLAYVP